MSSFLTSPDLRRAYPEQRGVPQRGKLLLFVGLSLADLALTWWLLTLPGGGVYEGNPVAQWWLDRFGWAGLAGFKAAVVMGVGGLAAAIARRRPRTGGLVLTFACAALTAVLLHSASLCRQALHQSRTSEITRQKDVRVNRVRSDILAYRAVRERAERDLLAGRRTLAEAADSLLTSERGRDAAWLETLAETYGRGSPRECLAINLILSTLAALDDAPSADPRAARRVWERLAQDYWRAFGTAPPSRIRELLEYRGFRWDEVDDFARTDPGRMEGRRARTSTERGS